MEDYLGKNFFWWLDLLFSGEKMNIFSIDFNRKWRIIFLIQKDNSLTFFMRQKKERFFQNCHFLITGRVVLHKKFYKKNFIYQLSKMEDYLGKKTFWVAGFIILGVKKWTFFLIDFNRKSEELSFNSKKIILWHFLCDKRRNVFFKIVTFW